MGPEFPTPAAPEEEERQESPVKDASTLHAEMQRRIASLEEVMAQLPGISAGIGHNRPPEPIDAFPLTVADKDEIAIAIEALKAQPVEPQDEGKVAKAAAEILKVKGQKIGDWLAEQGNVFIAEAVKEAGKEFGKWGPRTFLALVLDKLFSVHEIVGQWISQIQLPF